MFETNGHFLQVVMVSEQRATEIMRLQEALTTTESKNHNLVVKVKTLK
jgi:hypothetical protein